MSITPGHQGAPASADISTSGLMKPSTFEDNLTGDGNRPQEGSDEMLLTETPPISLQTTLRSGTSPWMESRNRMAMQTVQCWEAADPARQGVTACRRAARPPIEVQADLQTARRHTAQDRSRVRPGLTHPTSITTVPVRTRQAML